MQEEFQSTLPYGSDFEISIVTVPADDFNPRSLTGATENPVINPWGEKISIHAPLRERPEPICRRRRCDGFQSTLPYGSDYARKIRQNRQYHFNPRSLTGATRPHVNQISDSKDFNPRSLTGATSATIC